MHISKNRFGGLASCVCVLGMVSGCSAPKEPITTMWQAMGIPQATLAVRDGLTNRRGNFPGLERTPPLLRLADPANLESEIPAIKAAAKVKEAEDLAPQKVKALKYLASVGCGCYDKDGEIEAALLDALEDCTEEVRIEAANAIAEASGTCACRYDGCTPTCCKPSIVERLYAMAYEVDDSGCPIEPSREVREAAAAAVRACGAVPQEVVVDDGDDADDGEDLPPGEATEPTEDLPPQAEVRSTSPPEGEAILHGNAGTEEMTEAVVVPISHEIETPENMIVGSVSRKTAFDRLVILLDAEYAIEPGCELLLLTTDGNSLVCRALSVDGRRVEVGSSALSDRGFEREQHVFLGLVSE